MNEKEKQILREGVLAAAHAVAYNLHGDAVDDILFRIWSDTAHNFLLENGCPCTKGRDIACFALRSREEQIELFAEHPVLSFDAFEEIVLTGLHEAFVESAQTATAVAN